MLPSTSIIWIPAGSCSSCRICQCKVSQKGLSWINSLSLSLAGRACPSLPPMLIIHPQPALGSSDQIVKGFKWLKEQKTNKVFVLGLHGFNQVILWVNEQAWHRGGGITRLGRGSIETPSLPLDRRTSSLLGSAKTWSHVHTQVTCELHSLPYYKTTVFFILW